MTPLAAVPDDRPARHGHAGLSRFGAASNAAALALGTWVARRSTFPFATP